eukprot:1281248-Pyramimonas_sp.AAC.1
MSEGYFESQFCVLELAVAAAAGCKLVFVRDYLFVDKPDLSEGSKFHSLLSLVCDLNKDALGAVEGLYQKIKGTMD